MDTNDAHTAMEAPENYPEVYVKIDGILKPMCTVSFKQLEEVHALVKTFARRGKSGSTKISEKELKLWKLDEVIAWLNTIGTDTVDFKGKSLQKRFTDENIDGASLIELTGADLGDLGMKFGHRRIFMKELYNLLANHPREIKQREHTRKLFADYDTDNSGSITLEEFTQAFTNKFHGLEQQFIEDMFSELDDDGSGNITFEEFWNGMLKVQEQKKDQALRQHKDVEDTLNGLGEYPGVGEIKLAAGMHGDHANQVRTAGKN